MAIPASEPKIGLGDCPSPFVKLPRMAAAIKMRKASTILISQSLMVFFIMINLFLSKEWGKHVNYADS